LLFFVFLSGSAGLPAFCGKRGRQRDKVTYPFGEERPTKE